MLNSIHIRTGHEGEHTAATYLQQKGYEILHTNWRAGRAEVDIIARIGNDLVFVEVKTRSSRIIYPEKAVNRKKQEMMAKAANAYSETFSPKEEIRFDIVAIITDKTHKPEIEHFENAFFPSDQNFLFNF